MSNQFNVEVLRSYGKSFAIAAACLFGWYHYGSGSPKHESHPIPVTAANTKTPAVMETQSFVVKSVGTSNGSKFLNSLENYKSPGCQTIKLTGGAALVDANGLIGKSVTASGMTYQGRYGKVTTISETSSLTMK